MTSDRWSGNLVADWLVVFDAVGTLIRPSVSVFDVYSEKGIRFGSRRSRDEVVSRFKMGRTKIFKTAGLDRWTGVGFPSSDSLEKQLWRELVEFVFDDLADVDSLFDELWSYFGRPSSWELFPDVVECFRELAAQQVQYCIGSNFDSRLVPLIEELIPSFDLESIYYSSLLGYRKPDRNFYASIAKSTSKARQFFMIGDDKINDYEAPLRFGWQAILLDRNGQHTDHSARIANLDSIGRRIFELNS